MLKNIKASFIIYDLFLFNLNRVLRSILIPLTKLVILRADEVEVGFCQ